MLSDITNISKNFMYSPFSVTTNESKKIKSKLISELLNNKINSLNDNFINKILFIVHELGNKPFLTQEEILKNIKEKFNNNFGKQELININKILRESEISQNLILNYGKGSKYWKNTILPISESGSLFNTLEKNPIHPYRIGIYPGLSCMFECVFCGRNYSAKYDRSALDKGIDNYIEMISNSPKDDKFKFYISGGLEPLTNPKLELITKELKKNGFKVPLYTNGQMFTKKFLSKTNFVKDLSSIRISLYGTNEEQYSKTVQKKNQFQLVKQNIAELLKYKIENNLDVTIGLNYILLDKRSKDMLQLLDFIQKINEEVGNHKNNINFLTIREDFRSTSNLRMDRNERIELVSVFNKFQEKVDKGGFEEMFIDYGYSLEPIKNGFVDDVYEKVFADESILLKEGTPNISVAVDLYGDVYCYREAAFLDRPGSKRYILGRIEHNNKLSNIIEKSIKENRQIEQNSMDLDYLDAWDHIVLRTIDQAKQDRKIGIPFELGPVNGRIFKKNKKTVNFQTHFSNPLS